MALYHFIFLPIYIAFIQKRIYSATRYAPHAPSPAQVASVDVALLTIQLLVLAIILLITQ